MDSNPFRTNKFYGEFDPGSGRTLAACLIHASRAELMMKLAIHKSSGGRVSNAWAICPLAWDNSSKGLLTPDMLTPWHQGVRKVYTRG